MFKAGLGAPLRQFNYLDPSERSYRWYLEETGGRVCSSSKAANCRNYLRTQAQPIITIANPPYLSILEARLCCPSIAAPSTSIAP